MYKTYHGPGQARARFTNEVRILRHLEARGWRGSSPACSKPIPSSFQIITTNCSIAPRGASGRGTPGRNCLPNWSTFGVRHDDADMRNVTYRQSDGRFCVIDFELAAITPGLPE